MMHGDDGVEINDGEEVRLGLRCSTHVNQTPLSNKCSNIFSVFQQPVKARAELRDADLADAKARRERYFNASDRNWHTFFEKMESVINRVNPAWSYLWGTAAHLDFVACATKDRWSELAPQTKTSLIRNCREHFLASLSILPNGTVLLGDGQGVMAALQNTPLRMELQPAQLINVREGGGDKGWIGKVFFGGKEFPFRGWSSQVGHLSAVWRFDLAYWLAETFPTLAGGRFRFLNPD
jgi:hypothetical protein